MSPALASVMSYLRVPLIRRGVVVALVGGLGAWLSVSQVYLPARDAFATARAEVIAMSNARAEYDNRVALADRYLDLSATADALEDKLGATVDRSVLVEQFAELSAASGTRIVHGANRFGEERAGIVPVVQDLTVDGSYADIRRFLAGVGNLPTLTVLASVDLGATADGALVRGRMQFVTYSGAAP